MKIQINKPAVVEEVEADVRFHLSDGWNPKDGGDREVEPPVRGTPQPWVTVTVPGVAESASFPAAEIKCKNGKDFYEQAAARGASELGLSG